MQPSAAFKLSPQLNWRILKNDNSCNGFSLWGPECSHSIGYDHAFNA